MEWKIGDVRIIKVLELEVPYQLDGLLSEIPDGAVARFRWLAPDFVYDDGNARISLHGLLIDTGARRVLVDTCIGDMREAVPIPPRPSAFLDRLREQGYGVHDIDIVVCTHMHFENVGWNTRLVDGEWAVTFPNARYLFARTEWDYWSTYDSDYSNLADTVRPVAAAGAADLVEVDHRICDEVRLIPNPGHTPGHVSVVVESGGERAVITGDIAHHPIQCALPDLPALSDTDSAMAVDTRRRFLAERTEDAAVVIGTHFAGRTAGIVRADEDGWRLDALSAPKFPLCRRSARNPLHNVSLAVGRALRPLR